MSADYTGLAFALPLLVKAAAAVLVAWAATRGLVRSHAASRHAVWATALIVALLLPLLSLSSRKIAISLPALASRPVAVTPALNEARSDQAPSGAAASTIRAQVPARRVPWAAIAWGVYLVGVLIVLVPFGAGMRRANRLRRRAAPVDSHHAWRTALERVTKPRGFARVSVVTSCEITVPVTFGLFRPVVVLPNDVVTWSATELRDALVHEFAHIARFDWGFQLVGVLTCALHWFNPLVWMAERRLRLEAERACDERVLQLGANPHAYAEQLLALTRGRAGNHLSTTIAMSRVSCLANRVHTILNHRRETMKSKPGLTVAAIAATASVLLLALLQPVTAAQFESARHTATLPPLMKAIVKGDVDDVSRLIEDGADVNQRQDSRGTPLILAATYGHVEIAALLIEAGADVNRTERRTPRDLMRTPLTAAARNGHVGVVKLLLDNDARIDAAPPGDATALMEAAHNDRKDVVALLIDRDADVSLAIDGDGNAIIAAARSGNVDIAKMLVRAGADVNAGVPGDGNALIMAVRGGDRRMIEYLLSQGADPTAYVPGDETALVAAAEAGDEELMRLLLGAD